MYWLGDDSDSGPEMQWTKESAQFYPPPCRVSGDGQTMNTRAFQKAMATLQGGGGGTLLLTPGKWLTAPFNLTSHCTIYICAGATLLASDNMDDWPIIAPLPSYGQGRDHPG